MAQVCGFEGNSDMYGMGIRIGYYLQWYGAILAAWLAPDESKDLRIANSIFVTATFVALVILTLRDHSPESMPVVETYIILFLTFGSYLVLVPIYIWRVLTGCNPRWDPTRFPRVQINRVYKICNTVILVAVLVFQLWFWVRRVPVLEGSECPQYGFFFAKFELGSKAFRALNVVPSVALLGMCLYGIGMVGWKLAMAQKSASASQFWPSQRGKNAYVPLDGDVTQRHVYTLQILESVCQFLTTTTIVVGVELTILWNEIDGVHEIASAGQTIPLFIGVAAICMVLYERFLKRDAVAALGDGPSGNAQTQQQPAVAAYSTAFSAPTQSWEMGNVGYANSGLYEQTGSGYTVPPPPPKPSAFDDLPGAIRGGQLR